MNLKQSKYILMIKNPSLGRLLMKTAIFSFPFTHKSPFSFYQLYLCCPLQPLDQIQTEFLHTLCYHLQIDILLCLSVYMENRRIQRGRSRDKYIDFKDCLFTLLIPCLILAGTNRLTHLDHESELIKLNEKLTLTSTDIRSCYREGNRPFSRENESVIIHWLSV